MILHGHEILEVDSPIPLPGLNGLVFNKAVGYVQIWWEGEIKGLDAGNSPGWIDWAVKNWEQWAKEDHTPINPDDVPKPGERSSKQIPELA